MEEWEKQIILKNMAKLVDYTIVNTSFLSILLAKGILSEDDCEILVSDIKSSLLLVLKTTCSYNVIK